MGLKKWFGGILGEKEKPVYDSPMERNKKIREYQTFLRDYARIYGKDKMTMEFAATGENAPSHRLWLVGRDRGVRDNYNSLPAEVKSRLKPVYSLPPREVAPLPSVYQEVKTGRLQVEPAAYALGFDSVEGFIQVMKWLDSLVQENLMLKQSIEQTRLKSIEPPKKKRTRGPNKKSEPVVQKPSTIKPIEPVTPVETKETETKEANRNSPTAGLQEQSSKQEEEVVGGLSLD